MSEERIIWTGLSTGTARDAAEQFVRDQFNTERSIRFSKTEPGVFWFSDGMWTYRVVTEQGRWVVYRRSEQTKQGREYGKARRKAKRP